MIGSFALDSANRKTTRTASPITISPPTSGSVQLASWPELFTLPLLVSPSMNGTTPAAKKNDAQVVEVAAQAADEGPKDKATSEPNANQTRETPSIAGAVQITHDRHHDREQCPR